MLLHEYFDPHNKTHCEAYDELQRTGVWPRWFLGGLRDHNIELDANWQLLLVVKLANAWIEFKLKE